MAADDEHVRVLTELLEEYAAPHWHAQRRAIKESIRALSAQQPDAVAELPKHCGQVGADRCLYCGRRQTDNDVARCVDTKAAYRRAQVRVDFDHAQPQGTVSEPDFIARKHGDWWTVQVMCGRVPRSYAIRTEDGALFELPDDRAPFVVLAPPAALRPDAGEKGND